MKFLSSALALAACLPLTLANHKGFNIAAYKTDGSCKAESDWEKSFSEMKKIPGGFDQVRVYASSDCGTLQYAVPAAQRTGVKILAGVWTEDAAHFQAEKQALLNACNQFGVGWLTAISVGSEDLYRGDTNAATLAGQIKDVRGMMSTVKGGRAIPIGHVDTWTEWVNPANEAVIRAVDFVGMDGYPYYQGATIDNAKHVFYKSLSATRNAVAKVSKGKAVWVTETGWPTHGPNHHKSISSVKNAHRYWQGTICGLVQKHSTFVYTLRDYNAAPKIPSFGVLDKNWKPIFPLHC